MSQILSVNLGPLKTPWLQYCERHGMSPSMVTREVIRKLLGRAPPPMVAAGKAITGARSKKRVEVRISASEWQMLATVAESTGFSPNAWIVALVRAHLTKLPQLGQIELELLAESNSRVLAIGRNLNQIARALNATSADPVVYRPETIEALSDVIRSHTAEVAALIQSNVQRWSR